MHELPPLSFLPAFEAAGRLRSFARAAKELHLTASAISQQIKALELAVGAQLFVRSGPSVRLTPAGDAYLGEVQRLLSDLRRATTRLRRTGDERVLRLSTADFYMYEFILPRLSLLRARFPKLDLRVEAATQVVDFSSSDIDAALRMAKGPWPGLVSRELGAAHVAPVCSLELAKKVRRIADLRNVPLIQVRGQERRSWETFLSKHGETARNLTPLLFDSYMETIRAAEQGLGVAFGVFPITYDWVCSGRLAVPLAARIPLSTPVCFVYRERDASVPLFEELFDWLRGEYLALVQLPKGRVLARSAARVR